MIEFDFTQRNHHTSREYTFVKTDPSLLLLRIMKPWLLKSENILDHPAGNRSMSLSCTYSPIRRELLNRLLGASEASSDGGTDIDTAEELILYSSSNIIDSVTEGDFDIFKVATN